jgi:HemY protein
VVRAVLWLLALFGVAVVSALFAASNPGTVTLFWPPYRVDLSLNLVLLVLLALFVVVHLALGALETFAGIPGQARRWRLQQKERWVQSSLVDALAHLVAGRFVRARKAAEYALAMHTRADAQDESQGRSLRIQAILHLVAAESAHAVQDHSQRDKHFQQATDLLNIPEVSATQEGFYMRAARWALDDHDAPAAAQWLERLPQGAARRTLALRLRFRVARMQGENAVALETLRLLVKHRAISSGNGASISQALALELLHAGQDTGQILTAWDFLDDEERTLTDVALGMAKHWLAKGGDAAQSRQWLLPVWERMVQDPKALSPLQRMRLVRCLEAGLLSQHEAPDVKWVSRIESAQQSQARDPLLQYLGAVMCVRLSLWGKAQHLLRQCIATSPDPEIKGDAQRILASLEQRKA